ncbi:MAG: circadian clock KaiB family protein [Nitriliruptorales bacterium]|nr:circadian clock KaiB family protein [Nitriliruptorales bacterium]
MTTPEVPVVTLRLFVAGKTGRGERAICHSQRLAGDIHDLEIVDVTVETAVAERERILATPCLDRVAPLPRRRVIGDLDDLDQIADILGIASPEGDVSE